MDAPLVSPLDSEHLQSSENWTTVTDKQAGMANAALVLRAWRHPAQQANLPREGSLLQGNGNSFNDLLLQNRRCLLKIPLSDKVRDSKSVRACATLIQTASLPLLIEAVLSKHNVSQLKNPPCFLHAAYCPRRIPK